MGNGNKKNLVYAIDFGLAKRYRDPKTGTHIKYKDGKSLTGTARYASVNTHLGIEQSRRDDLEAIGYIIVYFLRGNLPWQGLKAKNMKEKYEKIKQKKINTSLTELCKGFPEETQTFIKYCRDLKFEERPDYEYLKKIIKIMAERENIQMDNTEFDWIIRKTQERKEAEKE
ncbi:MAG: hypothetical protein MJ252_16985 [archaeon]|nr:hypothetical protein [archaeon]